MISVKELLLTEKNETISVQAQLFFECVTPTNSVKNAQNMSQLFLPLSTAVSVKRMTTARNVGGIVHL